MDRITLLSFRTYGDYVLKAPFLFHLYRKHPHASVTLLTNAKGGQVYPLLDSRLRVVVADRGDGKMDIFRKAAALPRANAVYAMDDSRTTLLLALLVPGKRKTGWVQGRSRLYSSAGWFEWTSVRPWLSAAARSVFRPGLVRLPEGRYEADVELDLLHLPPEDLKAGIPLSQFRSSFALPPANRPSIPYVYCATDAGWIARQLQSWQWREIVAGLLDALPNHAVLVHGAAASHVSHLSSRVEAYNGSSIRQLFETVSAADAVIAPDSFALHLASLYGVPAIGYFGPAHPYRFQPTAPGSASLFRAPECSPCLQRRGELPCAIGLNQCSSLARLTAEDFVAATVQAVHSWGSRSAAIAFGRPGS